MQAKGSASAQDLGLAPQDGNGGGPTVPTAPKPKAKQALLTSFLARVPPLTASRSTAANEPVGAPPGLAQGPRRDGSALPP